MALRARGGRPVGLDVSAARLAQARAIQAPGKLSFPLVRADAERLPFEAESFDIVFCDWGAMTFCDPRRTVPEVSRVLRPGGVFAFSNSSPLRSLAQNRRTDRIGDRLLYPYFGLDRLEYPGETNFQRGYGEWVDLFRDSNLVVDRLIEPRPHRSAVTSYLTKAERAWARNWPLESIWRLTKPARGVVLARSQKPPEARRSRGKWTSRRGRRRSAS